MGELTPYLSGSAVLGFIAPLFIKYHEQRVMNEIVLGKHYQPTEVTNHLQNSTQLRAKLAEFNPAEQVLLQHLVTSTSDEKLRMFLLADKETRAEMLNRYPPTYQQRMNFLFRNYRLEDAERPFRAIAKIPKRLFEVLATQIRTASWSNKTILNRLNQYRQHKNQEMVQREVIESVIPALPKFKQ